MVALQLFAPMQIKAQDAPAVPKVQNCPLPTILFDAGRTNIKQSFYPKMFTIARFMVDNPDLRVKVTGHTDGVESNGNQLIKSRVQMTINFLVSQFSLDRDRFDTDFKNTGIHVQGSAAMNRRVEFQCLENK